MTRRVGVDNRGTVFEIARGTDTLPPPSRSSLRVDVAGRGAMSPSDAAGDLFGTTGYGGADGDGTVYEIAKSTGQLTTRYLYWR